MKTRVAALLCLFSLSSIAHLPAQTASSETALQVARTTIHPEELRAHIRFLADSLLQGREPGTPGYDIAARYVAAELEGMGLHPGVSGSWFQTVPLEEAVTDPKASSVVFTVNGKEHQLVDAKDYV